MASRDAAKPTPYTCIADFLLFSVSNNHEAVESPLTIKPYCFRSAARDSVMHCLQCRHGNLSEPPAAGFDVRFLFLR